MDASSRRCRRRRSSTTCSPRSTAGSRPGCAGRSGSRWRSRPRSPWQKPPKFLSTRVGLVIRRASQLFLPTLREAPADAEAVSHKLLVRGAYIRQVSAGLWTFLPLGWRVHEKVVEIIRQEMDAIGAQELSMPVLTPAELWKATGRYGIPDLFKLRDRNDREFVLRSEEHTSELQS